MASQSSDNMMNSTSSLADFQPRYPAYPEPPADHVQITHPNLTVKQRLSSVTSTLRGPLWLPLINQGFEKAWISICGEPGPQDRDVYDVEFWGKGRTPDGLDSSEYSGECIARLGNVDEAEAICARLNAKDPALRELQWLRIQDHDRCNNREVDYYQLEGRFLVMKKRVGPK